jgi:hypothetical protein
LQRGCYRLIQLLCTFQVSFISGWSIIIRHRLKWMLRSVFQQSKFLLSIFSKLHLTLVELDRITSRCIWNCFRDSIRFTSRRYPILFVLMHFHPSIIFLIKFRLSHCCCLSVIKGRYELWWCSIVSIVSISISMSYLCLLTCWMGGMMILCDVLFRFTISKNLFRMPWYSGFLFLLP